MSQNESLDYFEVFPWNKNFEIGHKEVDKQHKILVKLLNNLANTLINEKEIEIEDAFNELAKYADYHFDAEEKIWEEFLEDSSLLKAHKKSHTKFLPTVIELKEKNKDKSLVDIIEEIIKFLIRWLSFHIIDEDKRLAIVIKEIQKGKSKEEAKKVSDRLMNGSIRTLIEAILSMYDGVSARTLSLMRERNARIKAEKALKDVNKQLQELSITDQLTSLYNRRHFENIFDLEMKRARREKKYFSVILFDIDYFKLLNDMYGHAYGDEALKKIGKCLKETCKRPSDFAFRVGGEEFAIVFNCYKSDACYNLALKLQENINNLKIESKGSKISDYMTVSIGLVSIIPTDEDDLESVMKTVDKRLYIAKESGRNQIIHYN